MFYHSDVIQLTIQNDKAVSISVSEAMENQILIERLYTLLDAANLGRITGVLSENDYIAVIECLSKDSSSQSQAQNLKSG